MTNRLRIGCLVLGLTCLVSCGLRTPATEAGEVHVAAAANLRDGAGRDRARLRVEDRHSRRPDHRRHRATRPTDRKRRAGRRLSGRRYAACRSTDCQGLADPQSRAIYARGRLVLWAPSRPDITALRDLASPAGQPGRLRAAGTRSLRSGRRPGVEERGHLWKAVEPKLVYGQSISVAKQFADSGNVAASFTALSLVYDQPGHYVLIDERLHDPLDQALCIVKQSAQPDAARRFRDFVLGG